MTSSPPSTEDYDSPKKAEIFYFKLHKPDGRKWEKGVVSVQIAKTPFASGAFRDAFKAKITTSKGDFNCVLKKFKKLETSVDNYFLDCCTQMYAKSMADLYNQLNPPKSVTFIDAFVINLLEESSKSNSKNSKSQQQQQQQQHISPENCFAGESYVEVKSKFIFLF